MGLTLRRAAAAKGLLTAAALVALGATLAVAGLIGYGRATAEAGVRSALAAADPADRSILVRGSAGPDPAGRDQAVRAAYAGGLGGAPVTVRGAGYASGWAFAGPAGDAVPDADGIVYAAVVALEDLPGHAGLVAGTWPGAGAAALAEPVAAVLGVRPGGTLPLADRRTGAVTRLTVSGIWRPREVRDPYWQLVPEVFTGRTAQTATYGPVVVDRAEFDRRFATAASAGWVVQAGLDTADLNRVDAAAAATERIGAGLPETTGLGSSATVTTGLGGLRDRLQRAALVGRSALVTPVLLIVLLGAYTLLLVALLLTESRRGETAQLRARGAARGQLAALAGREALLVVLPAAVLAPPLAVLLIDELGRLPVVAGRLPLAPRLDATLWVVAAVAAAGGAVALISPAIRRGGTYVGELTGRSRRSLVQRAGLDLVLVLLAVLGWLQLRQYSSPLAGGPRDVGGLGLDPLLAAAPTLGVLAGAVIAIRVLPPAARLAARRLDRRAGVATMLGTWQAARRAHAGPMVLLALAVAAGTVSWCLAGTAERSLTDQADHQVGADLRLIETGGAAPGRRAGELAARPGLTAVLPGWHDTVATGPSGELADLIALDTARAAGVVRVRGDLAGGDPAGLFHRVAQARGPLPTATLRAGTVTTTGGPVRTAAVFTDGRRIDLGVSDDGRPLRFTVTGAGLAGFVVDGGERGVTWRITGLDGDWKAVDRNGFGLEMSADRLVRGPGRFAVTRAVPDAPVPIVATPQALAALRPQPDAPVQVTVAGHPVTVRVVATMDAIPGAGRPAAFLADLPALNARLFHSYGLVHGTQEWWISGDPRGLAGLTEVRLLDRRAIAAEAGREPFGTGARTGLFAAAVGALLLAGAGIAVDVQATARRRAVEMAVLHTLGAGPRQLARSLVVEQTFLAGLGALAGLLVGLLVAAAMAPLLILTPSAGHPVPRPLLTVDWWRVGGTAVLLVAVALALSAIAAALAGRRLPATRLRIGMDR